jgi:hypothetical protein
MWSAGVTLFEESKLPVSVTAVGLLGLTFVRRYRMISVAWLSYAAIYVAALFWLYLSSFPTRDVLGIPSFDRYATSLGHIGLLLVIVSGGSLLTSMRSIGGWLAPVAVIGGLLVALGWVPRLSAMALRDGRTKHAWSPAVVSYIAQGQQLIRLIHDRNLATANVVLIADGHTRPMRVLLKLAKYTSLDNGRQLAYRIVAGPTFTGETRSGPRASHAATAAAQFKQSLRNADVIWPVKLSPWMAPILRRSVQNDASSDSLESNLLVSSGRPRGHRRFACVPKQRSLTYPELLAAVATE